MKRPNIALMSSLDSEGRVCVKQTYLNAIWQSGGVATVLPYLNSREAVRQSCAFFDGFLFCGGGDIDPKYYGKTVQSKMNICSLRDEFEEMIFREAFPLGKPILGICRGIQVINVFLGGDLYQHIEGHSQCEPTHVTRQRVNIKSESLLHKIIGKSEILTNSFHHQNVKNLAQCLVCDAISTDDGYIEAAHHPEHKFCLGVQWHPEAYYSRSNTASAIFDSFIRACVT